MKEVNATDCIIKIIKTRQCLLICSGQKPQEE